MRVFTFQFRFFRLYPLVLLLSLGLFGPILYAQDKPLHKPKKIDSAASDQKINDAHPKESVTSESAAARLSDIQQLLEDKRKQRAELQHQLTKAIQEDEQNDLQQQIDALKTDIKQLNRSFEQIVIGGLDLDAFSNEPAQQFNWQEELVQATKPIIDGLKDLTEKPRKIEKLRSEISLLKEQLGLAVQALNSIAKFQPKTMPKETRTKFESVVKKWQQRQADIERNMEIARFQLASLQGSNDDWWQGLKSGMAEFVKGRGLTLVIAISAALGVWLLLRGLLWLYEKQLITPSHRNSIHVRLAGYAYRILTGLLVVLAIVMTFYLAGDFLLLTLAIIFLIAVVLSFRQILPHYINETRLLLDIGPVRIGERVVYNGLPMQVRSINIHSLLRNPDLKGVVRLPLRMLGSMVSRPDTGEPWFPCRTGEYVMLPDGRFGEVLQQTLELVQLQMKGSLVQFPAADFLQMELINLSRQGFVVVMIFGIDYQHQAKCLDEIPARLREALIRALEEAELNDKVSNLLVDFNEANTNSLDYLIVVNFNGEAAGSYFAINRLIQRTCVEVCNQEHWVIPFTQLTVHQGEGFQALSERNIPSHVPNNP